MKSIQITDEQYYFLMELSKDLNEQSHRGTAMPYFFQVTSTSEEPAVEGNGTEKWFYEGGFIESEEEKKHAVIEIEEWDNLAENEINQIYDGLDDCEISAILEKRYTKVWVEEKETFSNAFLTEKACKKHIVANGYHYNQPRDYLTHAFRNPELEMLMSILCQIGGGKIHK